MTEMGKAEIIGKRIECIIGIVLLIPPILGVIAFVINFFIQDAALLSNLDDKWTAVYFFDGFHDKSIAIPIGATSAAPIYFGLMAISGVYLIKDSIKYFLMKSN